MGLRINTNINAITAINNLETTNQNLQQSITRLSTGQRINSGSDDPSGLVISQQLKSQIGAISQVVQNSQNANNMISTADAALAGISNLLTTLQGSIEFALNAGGASNDQIAAQQNLVDQSVAAIDRIANTSRFGSNSLLNGSNAYQTITPSSNDAKGNKILQNLTPRSIDFPDGKVSRSFSISVAKLPRQGEIKVSGGDAAKDVRIFASGDQSTHLVTLRITGNLGTEDVNLASGTTTAAIASGINAVAGFTGVIASAVDGGAGAGDSLTIYSSDFGSQQNVRVEAIQGALRFINTDGTNPTTGAAYVGSSTGEGVLTNTTEMAPATEFTPGKVLFNAGVDGQVTMDGQTFTGKGVHFNINNPDAFFSFDLNRNGIVALSISSGTSASFTLGKGGLNFQLGDQAMPTDQLAVGIQAMLSNQLGLDQYRDLVSEAINGQKSFENPTAGTTINTGGFIDTITTGNANDLSNSPKTALSIVQGSIDQVSQLRAFLGAVSAYNIQPQINSLNVSSQNLQSASSTITDTDYAAEIANFTKYNIIFQAGMQVLATTNTVSQNVLGLLKGLP